MAIFQHRPFKNFVHVPKGRKLYVYSDSACTSEATITETDDTSITQPIEMGVDDPSSGNYGGIATFKCNESVVYVKTDYPGDEAEPLYPTGGGDDDLETMTVANKSGAGMSAGDLVYVSGYDTTLGAPSVTLADADGGGKVAELVLTEDIANNASGYAEGAATVGSLNTSGAAAVGDIAYLSTTAGGFSFTATNSADDVEQVVGVCVTKNATTGQMYFFPGRRVITEVPTSGLTASCVGTTQIADDSVTAAKTDTATAGTVEASKIVVASGDKDCGDFRNLDCTNLDAGASGTAGSVDVFPATASKGKLTLSCTNQTGNTTVTVDANAMAAARTINIPDPGKNAYVVTSSSAMTPAEVDVLDGLAQGSILRGEAGGVAAYDATGDGQILVGDGTDIASVAVSGDVTLANDGEVTIANDAVEAAMVADDQLDGSHAAVHADDNTTPCIPVLYSIEVDGGAAADDDITIAEKILVTDVWIVATSAGEASDTITIKNGTNAITDAMDYNVSDKAVVRAGTIDNAYTTIAASGTLRATTTDDDAQNDCASCIVYVLGHRVA